MNFFKKIGKDNTDKKAASGKSKAKSAVKKKKKSTVAVSKSKKIKKTKISRKSTAKKTKKQVKVVKEKSKEKMVGVITHHFGKIKVGIIKLKAELKVGDKIHIKGAHDDFTQVVKSMQIEHKSISKAQKGKEIGIKVSQLVHENDKVYLAEK